MTQEAITKIAEIEIEVETEETPEIIMTEEIEDSMTEGEREGEIDHQETIEMVTVTADLPLPDITKDITKIERESKYQPGTTYLKPPKLFELHKHYFHSVPQNLHNSLVDVFVCFRCFYVMIFNKDLFDPREQEELANYYMQLTQISN